MQDGEAKEMSKLSEWVNQTAFDAALCGMKKVWRSNIESCSCEIAAITSSKTRRVLRYFRNN